jgi:hypothetical protein
MEDGLLKFVNFDSLGFGIYTGTDEDYINYLIKVEVQLQNIY